MLGIVPRYCSPMISIVGPETGSLISISARTPILVRQNMEVLPGPEAANPLQNGIVP